jgi:capsular exopolysaccharide synthesis family protein
VPTDGAPAGAAAPHTTITSDLAVVLWRRRWVALAAFVAVLLGVAIVTASLPKVYQATSYMLVNPDRPGSNDFEQTQVSQALVTTYAQLLESQNLADEVSDRLGSAFTDNPKDAISVEAVPESQLLKITGEAGSPEAAQKLTNTYSQVFQQRIKELSEAKAASGRASVAEPATLPTAPVRPRPKLYLAIGAVLAALAALGVALLTQRIDQRLHISDDMTEVLGLPIIGRIPHGSGGALERMLAGEPAGDREGRAAAEAFRLLLANLTFANMGQRPRTVAVVSSDEREGKSTTALSLGRAAGELETQTLLVEADLRRPSLSAKAGGWVGGNVGFSSLLVHRSSLAEAAWALPGANVDLLPAGPLPPNPAALLGSPALREFDEEAKDRYSLVVYDTPPLSVSADASLVATITDGVLLVVDAKRTRRRPAAQAVDQLRRAHANILGVVVNRVDSAQYGSGYYTADPQLIVDQAADAKSTSTAPPR